MLSSVVTCDLMKVVWKPLSFCSDLSEARGRPVVLVAESLHFPMVGMYFAVWPDRLHHISIHMHAHRIVRHHF